MWRTSFISILFFLAVAGSVRAAPWAEGDKLPDLKAFGLVGEIPELSGKVVYLDFCAEWCVTCKQAFPEMDALYQKYKDDGFLVLAVNTDDTEALMKKFVKQMKPSFPVIYDAEKKLVESAEVQAMPTAYLVDRSGVIRYVHASWKRKKDTIKVEAELTKLLKEER